MKKYQEEILATLKKEYGIKNHMGVPRLQKVVINVGIGDIKDDQSAIDKIVVDVAALAGQKPVVTKAKQAISAFKLSKGQPVGVTATLRGVRMYDFLEKLITIVLPKVRDFRGLPTQSFDNQGNYTLGLREHGIFPEVDYSTSTFEKSKGLEISIVSNAQDKERGKRLLELMGMPFKKK